MNKRQKFKKFIIYFLLSIFISLAISSIYIFKSKLPDSFDNRIRDYFFKLRGEIQNTKNVLIVDIDEKSLKVLGQWPWSRDKVAKVIENLTKSNVGIIGFDVVFAEEDNSSPHKIFKKYNIKKDNIENYDLSFANVIKNSPTILGYQFELEDKKNLNQTSPKIPAIIIEKNKTLGEKYLIEAKGTILNTPSLQKSGYSSGFFNNIPDDSGLIRSVPLVISYKDTIYPSLALELLRVASNSNKITILYDENGITNVNLKDFSIPTDRHGRLLINFRGKERNFKYISALDIYNNDFKKEEIEGKIVLIGTSAAGLLDLRATPFESIYPGVEIHANVIDNILAGDFIYKASWIDAANILIIFSLSFLVIMLITYTPFWANPIVFLVFSYSSLYLSYEILFTQGLVFNIFFPLLTILASSIFTTLFDYFYEIRKEEAIKKKFASKVSKGVMDNLLKNMNSTEFQAMEKEITVFFSDIRDFTSISEKMQNAKELITYLNSYMEPMSNILTKYEGTIDKYIGDAIMAYWNAPMNVNNHADKAVQASLEQLDYLEILNKELIKNNQPIIKIGIGLNTGIAIIGEMGSIKRSDYTVIGDPINLGARLESLCKYYGSTLNISSFTKDKLEENYVFRYLDLVTVKGKDEAVEIWQVHSKGKAKKELKEELDLYHKAISLYKDAQFTDALDIFMLLNQSSKKTNNKINNKIYSIYISRCKDNIKNNISIKELVHFHSNK